MVSRRPPLDPQQDSNDTHNGIDRWLHPGVLAAQPVYGHGATVSVSGAAPIRFSPSARIQAVWQDMPIRLLLAFLFVMMGSSALGQGMAPGLVFSSNTVTVAEGGAAQTYTVKLSTQPTDEVTVRVWSQDTGAVTVSPLRLTFTTDTWNTAQTVTVTGVTDPDRAAKTVTLKHSAAGGDYDDVTDEVTASVTDNIGFTLTCGSTVAEGATLTCTLTNPGTSAVPWPGVAIFHRSDDNPALVRGGAVDVEFGTLTPTASVEGGVWWAGQILVAYERFDWSGNAAANASRSIPITALNDELYEGDEQFYITLTPNGSRNTTALYYDTHKQTITVTDADTASTDTSLASLAVRAVGAETALSTSLSGTSYTASVAYEVSEVVITPTATHPGATIVVGSDAEEVESGETSRIFQLAAEATTSIPVTVTAENGISTQTYTIALTRAARSATVTVETDSFSLACPSRGVEGTSLSCTLTNTGSSTEKFPVVALIHSSLDSDLATVAEDSILPASDPSYQDDVSFPVTVETSSDSEYTYGYGELFSGGSEEYLTYGYEKYTKTDDETTTTTKEDEVAAGATQTISIVPQTDTVEEDVERFYVGLAPAGYTGLKQLVANKVPLLIIPPGPTVPEFAASTVPRRVAENTPAEQNIGEQVAATDLDGDTLTYRLGGTDVASFTLDASPGQLQTKAALNYETKSTYHVTVHVYDGENEAGEEETTENEDDSIAVTITVTDVNEPPEVSGDSSVAVNYAEHDTRDVAAFSATDPESDTLRWTRTRADANDFVITDGVLSFRTAPDFEAPADTDMNNVYALTVNVSDGKDIAGNTDAAADATIAVTITVRDVDEAGSITLPPQPLVNVPFTATLNEPDRLTGVLTWQWARSLTPGNWADIARATAATYTPGADDKDYYLRVQATYRDVHVVSAQPPKQLEAVSGQVDKRDTNEPPEFDTDGPIRWTVPENTAAGEAIGDRVTATDGDDRLEDLTYALTGDDAARFTFDAPGWLRPVGDLNYEEPQDRNRDNVYEVTLTVTDPDLDIDTIHITIAVTDVNEAPVFGATPATRSVVEHTPPEQAIGSPLTATDEDTDATLTYTLDPASAPTFTINPTSGQLRTKAELNYETQPTYLVTVTATDNAEPPATATIDVTITVTDAPGTVTLSPAQPRIDTELTATLSDPDEVGSVSTWVWERSADRSVWSLIAGATTGVYTPRAADVGHSLRVTATYTDGDETPGKEALGVAAALVSDRPQSLPPRPPGGGPPSGGGPPGGGGAACTQEDVHGNTATQATEITLATVTAGAICPAGDVDYLTVTAPGRGLLFVDTTGGVNIRGTLWQHDVVLASGSTSRQPDDRLGARVQAGPVVVALQGQGGATGPYAVEITFVRGYLENPGAESFQSGVGVFSGWVCAADLVEIELNGVPQQAAYGTERLDTLRVCGDTDNGFGLLFNWNLLGVGEHEVVALVDGVELGRATVTVTTMGQEFLRDVTGTCEAADFPTQGEHVTLVWQQNSQNFVIAGGSPPAGANTGRTSALPGFLENPGHNSFQSGVRVLSGWVCAADTVELALGHLGRQEAGYGTERLDTLDACGDTDNGFGLLFNWNRLGEGEHDVVAFVDGVELGQATVQVTTLGQEFLRGAEGECVVEDFPTLGQSVLLEWQQNSQNFVITNVQ